MPDFYLDLVIPKVLQSMGWWLDTVDLKAAKPQIRFWIYASLWDLTWFACEGEATDLGESMTVIMGVSKFIRLNFYLISSF